MDMAGVASTKGKVASDVLRWKTTSRSPRASTRFRLPSSPAGPEGALIFRIRSIECLTALASSGLPSENFSPLRSSHR
ncbi:hypothetical protein SGLAM104S_10450 [Streptomyces glaucescens]